MSLDTIVELVRTNQGEVTYVAEPEALEFRASMETTPEDVVELDRELAEIGISTEDSDE